MNRGKGVILIVIGSMLWGATGPLIEYILKSTGMTVAFMLSIRLFIAGIFILGTLYAIKKPIFSIWHTKYWARQLLLFSVFGMLGLQFSFITAIEVSDAVFATLLQFLGPIFIVIFIAIKLKVWPQRTQVIGILGTFLGLFLLLTNFSFGSLLVSEEALLWGLAVGITFAFYTLYPVRLMNEWGVLFVVGWGMLLGSVILGLLTTIWNSDQWRLLLDVEISSLMLVLIFFGTLAFILFLSSMKYISPVLTSILSSVEPLTAMVISIFVFHTTLGGWQVIGVIIMLGFVTWLSIAGERDENYNN